MDLIAGFLELCGIYLLGSKKRLGFILNAIACFLWIYVAVVRDIYGLLLVVVPAIFLNLRGFIKWIENET